MFLDAPEEVIPSVMSNVGVTLVDSLRSSAIALFLNTGQVSTALATRAIMNDFVTEHVAVDAEMIMACLTLISATLAGTLSPFGFRISLIVLGSISSLMWRRDSGKW